MYNSVTTSQENAYSTEAKYTVADILSSMANGEGVSTSILFAILLSGFLECFIEAKKVYMH